MRFPKKRATGSARPFGAPMGGYMRDMVLTDHSTTLQGYGLDTRGYRGWGTSNETVCVSSFEFAGSETAGKGHVL
jgi:hypothetical protein